jgi:hypothetical protein
MKTKRYIETKARRLFARLVEFGEADRFLTMSLLQMRNVRRLLQTAIEFGDTVAFGDAANVAKWSDGQIAKLQFEVHNLFRRLYELHANDGGLMPTIKFQRIELSPALVDGEAVLTVDGSARDIFWFQVVSLLRTAGVRTLRSCKDPNCKRLFLRINKRESCSTRCQKRLYMREVYRADREPWRPDTLTDTLRRGRGQKRRTPTDTKKKNR